MATLLFFTAGCQKDQDFLATAKAGYTPSVGFGLSNIDALSIGVDASTKELDTAIKTFISGSAYGSATSVTIAVDTSIVNSYNNANGTSYGYMPSDVYTLTTSISIPANSKEGDGKLAVNIAKFLTYGTEFALGLSITKVSGGPGTIQTDHSRFFIVIQVKNPYDADYTVTGYLFHPSSPRAISTTKHLTTLGAVTCNAPLGDLGGSGYYFNFDVSSTNTLVNWVAQGSAPAAPSSGFFTADNPGGTAYPGAAPLAPGTAPYVQSTYNNTYDPSSSTFWMHYGYGGGSSSQNGWTRQIYEKWVRQ